VTLIFATQPLVLECLYTVIRTTYRFTGRLACGFVWAMVAVESEIIRYRST